MATRFERASSVATAFVLLCGLGLSCRSAKTPQEKRVGQTSFDVSPIDLSGFPDDPATRDRILLMRWGEAAARLGALSFESRTRFIFSRGNNEYEQKDNSSIDQDTSGNFHVVLNTPESQIEYFQIGEQSYVRYDKGHLRKKPRREADTADWRDIAVSSVRQSLELFQPQLTLTGPQSEEQAGRATKRYALGLAAGNTPKPAAVPEMEAVTSLPLPPPARWRELARPLDIKGHIWVDETTGVLTRLSLEGRVEIMDRQVRPSQLSLYCDAAMTNIGSVSPVSAPDDSMPEFLRVPRSDAGLSELKRHFVREEESAPESSP